MAYEDQWFRHKRMADWDWTDIFRQYDETDTLDMAVWAGENEERLSALGLATVTGKAIFVHYIEGAPDPACPLTGKRQLICLEVSTAYADLLGKAELRCRPVNEKMAELYCKGFGFSLETPRKDPQYYKREL